jgi:hypothetical protein
LITLGLDAQLDRLTKFAKSPDGKSRTGLVRVEPIETDPQISLLVGCSNCPAEEPLFKGVSST